ncbi:MAG: ABC transporter permease subunit, partial [Hyphomicrobium sp.]
MSANVPRNKDQVIALLVLGGMVLLWEVLSQSTTAPAVPPPSAILVAIWRDREFLATHTTATLSSAVLGLLLAIIVAIVVSAFLAVSNRARYTLFPVVLASQSVPLIAIAPVLASVIGEGKMATVIITAWLCWYPAVVAFTHAFVEVHPDRMALFSVAGATRLQTFRQLRLPGAAPALAA